MAGGCSASRASGNLWLLAQALQPLHVFGAAVFVLGSVHQFRCHRILRRLRAAAPVAGARAYGIPRGDWFERVSCAHYLVRWCDCVPPFC